MIDVAGNIARVRESMAAACERAGRAQSEVQLVLAAKYQPVELMLAALDAGEQRFGHNMVQQLVAAEEGLRVAGRGARTHATSMIGHVQSNKLSAAMRYAQRIDTVDSLKMAQQIARRQAARIAAGEAAAGEAYPILLQVNSSGASTQFGCEPITVLDIAHQVASELPLVEIRGLMTIGANEPDDPAAVIRSFEITRQLSEQLREIPGLAAAGTLSMGMTHDMELAIENGSTEIRIGTAIFGPRPNSSQ